VEHRLDTLRSAPMVELRRGTDLIVAGVGPSLAGGAVWDLGVEPPRGWAARGGVQLKHRLYRFTHAGLWIEGGIDVAARQAQLTAALLLGWASVGHSATSTGGGEHPRAPV
jgi:hypothetical protein